MYKPFLEASSHSNPLLHLLKIASNPYSQFYFQRPCEVIHIYKLHFVDKLMDFLAVTSSLAFSLVVLACKSVVSAQGNQEPATCINFANYLPKAQRALCSVCVRVTVNCSTPSKITLCMESEIERKEGCILCKCSQKVCKTSYLKWFERWRNMTHFQKELFCWAELRVELCLITWLPLGLYWHPHGRDGHQ